MLRRVVRAVRRKFGAASGQTSAIPTDFRTWLRCTYSAVDYLSAADLAHIERKFAQLPSSDERLFAGKAISDYFTAHCEKAALIAGSEFYVSTDSVVANLVFIASSYVQGQSGRAVDAARRLAELWPNDFTAILLSRVLEDSAGARAEYEAISEAQHLYPNSLPVMYNLIENLIGSDRVEEANAEIDRIKVTVASELADEIAIVKRNQAVLDQAIIDGSFAPKGDEDIYTEEMCRNYWTSYFESYVTRRARQHGDRLLLERFVQWAKSVENEVDVILDFGSLCAQPLYEAALAIPSMKLIGTDRQQFIAEMNQAAYPIDNLAYDSGDIFEVMERVANLPGRKALAHVRTTCTLYPRFVEALYDACARLGFEHIYLIENAGLVRTRLAFMPFDTMSEPAVVTKHRLNLHNYKSQLERAGYSIVKRERVRAPGLWRGEQAANYLGSQHEIHAVLAR